MIGGIIWLIAFWTNLTWTSIEEDPPPCVSSRQRHVVLAGSIVLTSFAGTGPTLFGRLPLPSSEINSIPHEFAIDPTTVLCKGWEYYIRFPIILFGSVFFA